MISHLQQTIQRFLAPYYVHLEPYAYALLRVTSGGIMAMFGWSKLFRDGMGRDIAVMQALGFEPAIFWAYFTSALEFFGGLAIIVGLLTRLFGLMFFFELIVIILFVMIPRGSGYELSVVWLGVFSFITLHGGGKISIDRLIEKKK